jgi:hypothetical protein
MELKHRVQLLDLVSELGLPLEIVEVGVAEGNFSLEMLRYKQIRLFMVDSWRHIPNISGDGNFDQEWHDRNFEKAANVANLFPNALMTPGFSAQVAQQFPDNSFSLVYLDADHSFNGVLTDLHAWYPNVRPGGIIAGHDYLNPAYGVKEAVSEFVGHLRGVKPIVNIIPENSSVDASFYFIKPFLNLQ